MGFPHQWLLLYFLVHLGPLYNLFGQAFVSFGVFCSRNSTACDSRHIKLQTVWHYLHCFGLLAIRLPLLGLVLAHLWTVVFQFVAYFIHPAVGCLQKRFFSTNLPTWFDCDGISHVVPTC